MQVYSPNPKYSIVDTIWPEQNAFTQLVRGPKPEKGEMPLLFKNFKTVINLEVGWYDIFHGEVFYEQNVCKEVGIQNYYHRPMSDFWAPTPNELCVLVKLITVCLQFGNVLVHCLHGEDRTGMVCAAYRICVNKWSPNAAIQEMKNNGFHTIPYFYWIPALGVLK